MKPIGYLAKQAERAIDWSYRQVAPRRAALRAHFKRMATDPEYFDFNMALLAARGYRAAKSGTTATAFGGGNNSADAELLHDLPNLRARSRELRRDDPIGSGIVSKIVNNVVGSGLRAQSRHDDSAVATRIEAVWNRLKGSIAVGDDLTHGQHQGIIIGKLFEDGEVFIHRAKRGPNDPVFMEIIEADRVATPPDQQNNKDLVDGIERDEFGHRVAYYVAKGHPSNTGRGPLSLTSALNYQRIPAEDMKHLRRAGRPGQTRGEPGLHAVMQDLRDLDLLIIAALKRSQVAACLAAFITSDMPLNTLVDATAEKYGYQIDQTIEPGMLFKLNPGEKIESFIPNFPVPELVPFIIMLARRIGAALGLSWQLILSDFSQSNYSSARTDLLESRRVFTVLQAYLTEKYLNWEWESVLIDAVLRGEPGLEGIGLEQIRPVYWIANGWQWVDPVKEAQATEIELRMNSTTLRAVCAQKGEDWEEVLRQRIREEALEMELRKAAGLPEKMQPNAPGAAASTPAPAKKETDSPARAAYLKDKRMVA